jgi:hypothetical protein
MMSPARMVSVNARPGPLTWTWRASPRSSSTCETISPSRVASSAGRASTFHRPNKPSARHGGALSQQRAAPALPIVYLKHGHRAETSDG